MRKLLFFLGLWVVGSTALLTVSAWENPLFLTGAQMLWFLIFFWIVVCGGLMYALRDTFVKYYSRIKLPFWLKFALFATLFALLEEAIALSINNAFAERTGGMAILTAATGYWELVSRHSVIALIPIFLLFGFLIKHFRLSPGRSFIYFGIIGVFAEMSVGGWLSLFQFGMWIFVYGLMVYLPSHGALNDSQNTK